MALFNEVYYHFLISVKFPVLVNRGWVPRSWRDKFLETLDDAGKPTDASETSVQKSEEKSWWKLWSKKPKNVEVVLHASMVDALLL